MARLIALCCLLLVACAGPEGDAGPMGPQGPRGFDGAEGEAGPGGFALVATYTAQLYSSGHRTVSVPEIAGKVGTTYVLVYWSFPTSHDLWTPMADGWIDSVDMSRSCAVSWTLGSVFLFGLQEGESYLIQVYELQG